MLPLRISLGRKEGIHVPSSSPSIDLIWCWPIALSRPYFSTTSNVLQTFYCWGRVKLTKLVMRERLPCKWFSFDSDWHKEKFPDPLKGVSVTRAQPSGIKMLWQIASCSLTGTRNRRTSASAYAIRAWASAGAAKVEISTCKSSNKCEYRGSPLIRNSSSFEQEEEQDSIKWLWFTRSS